MAGFTDRSFLDDRHPNAPRPEAERVVLLVRVHNERPASILVSLEADGGVGQAWLPRSQITIEGRLQLGLTARIALPRWLALDKGLIAAGGDGQGRLL